MKYTIWDIDFEFKENAYKTIESYISEIRDFFNGESDTETTVDIEFAISDKFERVLADRADKTLVLSDVEQVVRELGTVEMITGRETLGNTTPKTVVREFETGDVVAGKKLFRDPDDGYIGWVCSWIAYYFGIDSWIVRVIFLVAFFAPLPSVIPYLLLWIFVPLARSKSDKLRMRWVPVSLDSLSSDVGNYTGRRMLSIASIIILWILILILALISGAMVFLYQNVRDAEITGYEEIHYEYSCANEEKMSITYPILDGREVWIRSENGAFNISLDIDEIDEEIPDFVYIEVDWEIEFLEKTDAYTYESEEYTIMEDANGREYPILKKDGKEIRTECEITSQLQRRWDFKNILREQD